jgi:hypothetical protein
VQTAARKRLKFFHRTDISGPGNFHICKQGKGQNNMTGIPTLIIAAGPTDHTRLRSPKSETRIEELNPYMLLHDDTDRMDLSSQTSRVEAAKPGKIKALYYKTLDLFSPTTLPAIQKASQRLSHQHLTQLNAIQHSLETYLQLRAGYKEHQDTTPKKAPRALLDTQKQYKTHAKQLKAHIQLLEKAHRLHGNAFVDTKRADLNRAYDKIDQHLGTLKEETETLFPTKKSAALLFASLYLDYADDQALKQIKAYLENSSNTLTRHVIPESL